MINIKLPSNIRKFIFDLIGENYFPLLRLVCKDWNQLLIDRNNRCSLITLVSTANLSLLKYLEYHKFTDYSNYLYFISLCESTILPDFKIKQLEYLKSKGTPLNELCFNSAVKINDISTIKWLYDNLCPLPNNVLIQYPDNNLYEIISQLEKYKIKIKFDSIFVPNIPKNIIKEWISRPNLITRTELTYLVYRLGYEKYAYVLYDSEIRNKLLFMSIIGNHWSLINYLINKCSAKLCSYMWFHPIKTKNIEMLNWFHEHNAEFRNEIQYQQCEYNYIQLFKKNDMELNTWFLNKGYFKKYCPWKLAFVTFNVELYQWLWDNNIRPINVIFSEELIKKMYNFKTIYVAMNWCIQHNLITKDYDISPLIRFNNIDLLNYYFNLGYKLSSKAYINAIKYGSCKILDWLWTRFEYQSDMKIDTYNNIIKHGCKQMYIWFKNKKICLYLSYSDSKFCISYPNHQIIQDIPLILLTDEKLCINLHLNSLIYLYKRYGRGYLNLVELFKIAVQYLRTDIIMWIIKEQIKYKHNNNLKNLNLRNIGYNFRKNCDSRFKNWAIQQAYL